MRRKAKLVYTCDLGHCSMAGNRYDCRGAEICEHCKLCTLDGMVITKVSKDGSVYEVCSTTTDEIILYSREKGELCSLDPDYDKFMNEYSIVETEYDYR